MTNQLEHASVQADRSEIKSLRKALAVLGAVVSAERSPTIAEVAFQAGISRPTAYRIVQTLVSEGFLVHGPDDGRLYIGFETLPLAANLLDRNRMRLEAMPYLHSLASKVNERTNLGVLHRNKILYLAGVEKPSLPMIYSRFGKTVPVHCSSLGKAILAYLPEEEIRKLVDEEPLVRRTPATITELSALFEDLALTRERGYALDCAESSEGTYCIAAPIFDAGNKPVGAIGLSGRDLGTMIAEAKTVCHTAEVISHIL
jgi:DNA-binding IclR family transcriptional regulator